MSFRNRFDDEDEEDRKDTEITLGLGSLLGIFFGLVLLCGLFFGFGYSLGHGHTAVQHINPSAATPETPSTPALATGGSKPAAQQLAPPPPAPADPNAAQTATTTTPAGDTATTPAQSANQQPAATPQPQQTATPQAAQQVVQNTVPATPAQTAAAHQYMVQVAAVSRPQDASVLVAALEQRGFHAVTRTDSQDHLMHVQIGPFPTAAAANQVRSRLMADGYNAILKQ
ncbi:MAG: SPOR domain-containing protein [Acidobacteriaceae bacterium]